MDPYGVKASCIKHLCVCFQLIRWTQKAPKWTPVSVWRGSPARRRRGFEWSAGVDRTRVGNTCSDKGLLGTHHRHPAQDGHNCTDCTFFLLLWFNQSWKQLFKCERGKPFLDENHNPHYLNVEPLGCTWLDYWRAWFLHFITSFYTNIQSISPSPFSMLYKYILPK